MSNSISSEDKSYYLNGDQSDPVTKSNFATQGIQTQEANECVVSGVEGFNNKRCKVHEGLEDTPFKSRSDSSQVSNDGLNGADNGKPVTERKVSWLSSCFTMLYNGLKSLCDWFRSLIFSPGKEQAKLPDNNPVEDVPEDAFHDPGQLSPEWAIAASHIEYVDADAQEMLNEYRAFIASKGDSMPPIDYSDADVQEILNELKAFVASNSASDNDEKFYDFTDQNAQSGDQLSSERDNLSHDLVDLSTPTGEATEVATEVVSPLPKVVLSTVKNPNSYIEFDVSGIKLDPKESTALILGTMQLELIDALNKQNLSYLVAGNASEIKFSLEQGKINISEKAARALAGDSSLGQKLACAAEVTLKISESRIKVDIEAKGWAAWSAVKARTRVEVVTSHLEQYIYSALT